MKQNIFYTWLTPVISVVVTLAVFLLLIPEHVTALYWINMVYTLLLEALFWGWYFHRNTQQTSMWGNILGTHIGYYIAVGATVMIAYAILYTVAGEHNPLPLKGYIVILLLLSLVWFIVAVLLGRNDAQYHSEHTRLEAQTGSIRQLSKQLEAEASKHSTAETAASWQALLRAFQSIPPARVDAAAYQTLAAIVKEVQQTAPDVAFNDIINRIKII